MLKPGDLVQVDLPLRFQPGFLHEKRGITIKTFEYINDKESIGWITFIDGGTWRIGEVYLVRINEEL
jgi:hypothetical protein